MKKLIILLLIIFLSGCGSGVKPDADAGPDQIVLVNDLVTLDASGTTDHDNDPLTYSWAIITAPETSTATLTDSDTIITTQYLSLVDDWNSGIIIATQITVPAADAFHPELYEVIDWAVSLKPTE